MAVEAAGIVVCFVPDPIVSTLARPALTHWSPTG